MIEQTLATALKPLAISQNEFSELIIRLLDYGVINREESNVEAQLYDRYLLCSDLVEEYLRVLHIRIFHDAHFNYVRVFPPGAEVPGMADDDNTVFTSGLRQRPSQQEVALILVLRVEYEKAVREGLMDDKGCVMISFEGLVFAMKNLLKRNLPEQLSERSALFKRLRQLRLLQFNHDDELNTEDAWFSIQPSIVSFVSEDAMQELYPSDNTEAYEGDKHVL